MEACKECLSTASDTTENKRAEEQLQQNQELHGLIVDNLKDYAVFTIGLDGKLSSWNPGVEEVLGYKEAEFIGLPGATIFTPEDREKGEPEREREGAVQTGRAEDDRWHLRKDGTRIWVNGILTALHDTNGNLRGFAKIMRDYTDRKLHEEELEQRVAERTEELRRAEDRFEQVFRVGPFAAALTTMGEEHTFLDANESFEHLTGYACNEVLGKTNRELGMWSAPKQAELMHALLTEQGQAREVELTVTTKDAQERLIIASAAVVGLNGEEMVVRMFYDITERKRNEEELSQAIQEVMKDAAWFSRAVVERLANIRSGKADMTEIAELTPRERQVLERIASGMNNDEIGRDLGISGQTVRNYISLIYSKIHVRTRAEAVVWARERGLVGP